MKAFNRRLQAAGADSSLFFYESARPKWLPPNGNHPALFNEFFLALDSDVVRGAYALKHEEFAFADGSIRRVACYHHPISEGIVDRSFSIVGGFLLRDAMERRPLLYCLGMGGYDRPLPKMLASQGWGHFPVPFYFRVVHPSRFVRELRALRRTPTLRFITDIAAYSGAAWTASKAIALYKRALAPHSSACQVEVVDELGPWTDTLWQQSQPLYAMAAVRNSARVRTLFPAEDRYFTRLRVISNGEIVGWAVVGEKRKDANYGSLRVGSIVDCWARPESALSVIRAATEELERAEVDLIVSNQSHRSWGTALETAGYLKAKSNFIFAASSDLAELLQPFEDTKCRIHLTRADGDGLPRNF